MNNFKGEFEDAMGGLDEMFDLGGMEDKLDNLKDALETKAENLINVLAIVGGAIVGAIIGSAWGLLAAAIGAGLGAALGAIIVSGGNLWDVLPFAEGGVVPGPEGAPVPALVHGGETIIPPDTDFGGTQNISVRLDIDGRELNSRLSEIDRRDEYTAYGSTRGKEGGYGRG